MAKQKIVLKVMMKNDKKTRKAMKIIAGVCGVESVALVGPAKEQIAVTGEGIDSIELACKLRKSFCGTEVISVGPLQEKKTDKPDKETPVQFGYPCPQPYPCQLMPLQIVRDEPCNSCRIM